MGNGKWENYRELGPRGGRKWVVLMAGPMEMEAGGASEGQQASGEERSTEGFLGPETGPLIRQDPGLGVRRPGLACGAQACELVSP